MEKCFHCGDPCIDGEIKSGEKTFCCQGCRTVYEILQENQLGYYYDLEKNPGISPKNTAGKFDFLENEEISRKLLEFNDGQTAIVNFSIPSIHCSSCIWILENLNKINPAIKSSQVNFPKKTARITFTRKVETPRQQIALKELVMLLSRIGYEPHISLENAEQKKNKKDRSLIYKVAIAGFAFGNIMFLSLPEYFESTEFWLDQFKPFFRWMMFTFSLPVVFYSATGYFKSAWKGLRAGMLNIDVPIALGVWVLFIRSTLEIALDWGTGYFDSLAGLIFFLLLGKFAQQRTYAYLSFERDYKSYFPLAVTRINKTKNGKVTEEQTEIRNIKKGDRLLIKNHEILPVDAVLIKGNALIDYSFVTGEAEPVPKTEGDKLFAGGKQQAGMIEVEVLKPTEQSYLTQLWSNEVFSQKNPGRFKSITDKISKHFTLSILAISVISTLIWLLTDPSKAFFVFTAVLIIACPCAIALAAPFTLGNGLRIFGARKLYLKESAVIEKMAATDAVVFDKTGTLTTNRKNTVSYKGASLTDIEKNLLVNTLRASNHPLSRVLYKKIYNGNLHLLDDFKEETGRGMTASYKGNTIKIGAFNYVSPSAESTGNYDKNLLNKTAVHISINKTYKGCYIFSSTYRKDISKMFTTLAKDKKLVILSGDNEGERSVLETLLPAQTVMLFNQKPDDKLNFIKNLQEQGHKTMMIGDGLNDAGALKQSDTGIVISENTNVFTPACDGILDASAFHQIPQHLSFAQKSIQIIRWAFILSLLYNVVGLSFAVTGHLRPVVAAILMPLSSISIVLFTTLMTRLYGRRLLKKDEKDTPR